MSRTARLLFGLIFFSGAFCSLPRSTSAEQKPKLKPLHIALANHSVTMTAIYVAKQLGIYENYGFDARVLVLEPRAALAALLTEDLHFYTAIGSTGRAALRGVPVRVGLVALNRPDFMLVASKEIANIEQLRGRVIGGYVAQGTVNVILVELLRRKDCDQRTTRLLTRERHALPRSPAEISRRLWSTASKRCAS